MQHVDTLIRARHVVPVEPAGAVLDDHTLAIGGGRIVGILPAGHAAARYEADAHVDLPHHALIPGLVNAHTHAGMTLLRGLADDLPLMAWLRDHIWPVEGRWISEEFVHTGVQLAVAEMLRGGTTCFSDMYFFPEVTARTALGCGIRACVGLIVLDFPTLYASGPDEYIGKGLAVHDEFRGEALISAAFAPHAPYTVSNEPLSRLRTFADELDIPVQMHVHETRDEIEQGMAQYGMRPLERLDRLGLVSPALMAVHMTCLLDEEIARFADSGAHVVHCPESNLKLASGMCPVKRLEDAGINVALGTDGAASNNDLDMIGEMRTAALLAKGVAEDATAVPAHQALRMATLNGATALGLGDRIGSLVPGKAADIAAVRLDEIESLPCYDVVSQLVYAGGRDKVTDVWVAGQHVLAGRELLTLDVPHLLDRVRGWNARISGDR